MTWLYESPSVDPYYNLAVEEHLLSKAENDVILYLWQNAHTVVIGKNQNPWKECKTTLLKGEGGHLARRLSGGGAVYHDLGNLNFTFLMPQRCFDTRKQFSVILEALETLGIRAEFSGRNDLLAQGRKFSGNAYYKNGTAAYHHGTLLVNADMEKLGRYLSPDRKKLQSKGVDSVPSRVCNLSELDPAVTVDALRVTLKEAFGSVYGEWESLTLTDDDRQKIHALTRRNRDWAWNYGQNLPFTLSWEERFPWGGVEIHLQVEQGRVAGSKVYTDAMDATLADRIEDALRGCVFSTAELTAAVEGLPCGADLGRLIMRQEL